MGAGETRILTLHGLHLSEDVQICYYPELHLSEVSDLSIETVGVEVRLLMNYQIRSPMEVFAIPVAMHLSDGCRCV